MPHLLAKLKNVPIAVISEILEKDKIFHAENNMFLEHLWQNADDENEVFFLFRINDIDETKAFIHQLHADALTQDDNANLPIMTYLK
ncbi:MAG: hypothetical protein Q8R22_06895 [Flavobacterium sp.]|uniref:hypothetical protein n=1 Tax=Flavobacterium sp. TaxID=239 RepID=UPI0027349FFA|nr:hypothetical protein [Flavobacterium sp.]MDP3680545.1 hypothetical protein [Flavobacterium sp.]